MVTVYTFIATRDEFQTIFLARNLHDTLAICFVRGWFISVKTAKVDNKVKTLHLTF